MLEIEEVTLTDETRVGDQTWKELRPKAMAGDHKKEPGDHTELRQEDKQILELLRTAQHNQGNLEPLVL